MCNNIHAVHESIEPEGIGYKIFTNHNGKLRSFICDDRYLMDPDQWVSWNYMTARISRNDGDGFCFFLTIEEAQRALHEMRNPKDSVIVRIKYKDGICKQDEHAMTQKYNVFTMALCKSWKLADNNEFYHL